MGQSPPEAARRRLQDLTTQEIKDLHDSGQGDSQMVAVLLQRLEEAERKTRSTASLHSAVEFVQDRVHSQTKGRREIERPRGPGYYLGDRQEPSASPLSITRPLGLPAFGTPSIPIAKNSSRIHVQAPHHFHGFPSAPSQSQVLTSHGVQMQSYQPQQFHGFPSVPSQPQVLITHGAQVQSCLPNQFPGFPSVPSQSQVPVGSTQVQAMSRASQSAQAMSRRSQSAMVQVPFQGLHTAVSQPHGIVSQQASGVHVGIAQSSGGQAVPLLPNPSGPMRCDVQSLDLGQAMFNQQDMRTHDVSVASMAPTAMAPTVDPKHFSVGLRDLLSIDSGAPDRQPNVSQHPSPVPFASLLDLDPIPITKVAFGTGTERAPALSTTATLIDVFDPSASTATPFVPPPPPPFEMSGNVSPRTPRVGTSYGPIHTPGGTKVPEGPPPATPPKAVGLGTNSYPFAPASPIQPPPAPPAIGDPSGVDDMFQSGSMRSEEPSRLVHNLPTLDVGEGRSDVSVITGDWLARIAPIMRSLSPSAPKWWNCVVQTATEFYTRWLHADPLQKLGIKGEAIEARMDFGNMSRVEGRGSILLLQALPTDLQTEVVSVRALASSSLLFMVMSRYQPGGSTEKSMILSYLTQPHVEGQSNVHSTHAALRKWDRLFRRGRELGLQSPDPILLVRGLDVLGRIIHNKSPTAAFTVSTFRHKYQLDSAPSEASVLHYCQLLTAELETLCLSGPDNKQQRLAALQVEAPPKKGQGKGVGSVARSGGNSSNPLNEDGVCKFFASSNGCRYGRSCVHHHSQLTPADNRCFNCGAEGHAMAQCERPTAKLGPKGGIPIPKMPSFPKTEGKGEAKGIPKADPKTSATPNPKAKPNPKTKRLPKGRRLGVSEEQGGAVDEGAEQREDGSWEGALKSVCIEGPHLMASLKGITLGAKSGLLDGGATHCLRFGPFGEYQQARPIEVHLASGTTQELRINAAGTLISPNPDIQPIMPMGLLTTELKCDIRWDESECVVNHPRLGPLEVTMVKNCPEVDDKVCLELIREVEELRADAMVRSVQTHAGKEDPTMGWHGMSDEEFLVSLRKWAKKTFEDVPERIQSKLAPSSNCDPAESGLNRHTRRKLERDSAFIHLFCGQQRWDLPGAPSLALDLNRGYDFLDDKLYGYLLRLGRMGCIQYLLGGPPCRTFTSLRGRGTGPDADGGPRVVRTRHGTERFGLTDLTPEEWDQVDGDTTLVLRFLVLADVSAQGLRAREGKDKSLKNPKLFFGFEHPEDPEEFLRSPETGPWPSGMG